MAGIYTEKVQFLKIAEANKAVENTPTTKSIGSATPWGQIIAAGGGKSTVYEEGNSGNIIFLVAALVALVLLIK